MNKTARKLYKKYDGKSINLFCEEEVEKWCGELGCNQMELYSAVRALGNSPAFVARYIREQQEGVLVSW